MYTTSTQLQETETAFNGPYSLGWFARTTYRGIGARGRYVFEVLLRLDEAREQPNRKDSWQMALAGVWSSPSVQACLKLRILQELAGTLSSTNYRAVSGAASPIPHRPLK